MYLHKVVMARKAEAGNVSLVTAVPKSNESNCFTLPPARSCSFRSAFWRLNNVRKGGTNGAFWKQGKERERSASVCVVYVYAYGGTQPDINLSRSLACSLGVRHFNTDYLLTLPPPVAVVGLPLSVSGGSGGSAALELHNFINISLPSFHVGPCRHPYFPLRPCRPPPLRELHRVRL